MNDPKTIDVSIDLEGDLPVSYPEVQLLADLLPQLIKDILALQADMED